jgi:hypothetical protein
LSSPKFAVSVYDLKIPFPPGGGMGVRRVPAREDRRR